ncbi:nucleoside hydrolase-like domain-containing protein [Dactylosporangium sp. CA-233914]|uniref:nucleoside hydrolase-like domain-containing protein n=1 Tax=Dactylosporangium sp. CA-233914 TaxID=3239934 RepID=UPI003D93FE22
MAAKLGPRLADRPPWTPTPAELWSKVAVGNVDFENDFHADTPGSDLIKKAILDNDTRPLYLEAWGGTNTIARALKSIEDEYNSTSSWSAVQAKVNQKAVIAALGMQDNAYADYIGKSWPKVKLYNMGGGPGCSAVPANAVYCSPEYWTPLKYSHGPLIEARSFFGDGTYHVSEEGITSNGIHNWEPGQAKDMETFRLYNRGDKHQRMEFAGEGDSPTFLFLLNNGLRATQDPSLGSWGGRYKPSDTIPTTYNGQADVNPETGTASSGYASQRWTPEMQNDFAGRIEWGASPAFTDANHNPVVKLANSDLTGKAGKTVEVSAKVTDPDGDNVKLNWSVYTDASTVTSPVAAVQNPTSKTAYVTIPDGAKSAERIVVVLTVTDKGTPALSKYGEVVITVK